MEPPASWLPGGGGGTVATGVAASNSAWVAIGPAVEKRKSKRAAVPQYRSSPGKRAKSMVIELPLRSLLRAGISLARKRAGGPSSCPYTLLLHRFTFGFAAP